MICIVIYNTSELIPADFPIDWHIQVMLYPSHCITWHIKSKHWRRACNSILPDKVHRTGRTLWSSNALMFIKMPLKWFRMISSETNKAILNRYNMRTSHQVARWAYKLWSQNRKFSHQYIVHHTMHTGIHAPSKTCRVKILKSTTTIISYFLQSVFTFQMKSKASS